MPSLWLRLWHRILLFLSPSDKKRRAKREDERRGRHVFQLTAHRYAVAAAIDLGAAMIITVTETGLTTRLVCKYRPPVPVVAITTWKHTMQSLTVTKGTLPMVYYTTSHCTSVDHFLPDSRIRISSSPFPTSPSILRYCHSLTHPPTHPPTSCAD